MVSLFAWQAWKKEPVFNVTDNPVTVSYDGLFVNYGRQSGTLRSVPSSQALRCPCACRSLVADVRAGDAVALTEVHLQFHQPALYVPLLLVQLDGQGGVLPFQLG